MPSAIDKNTADFCGMDKSKYSRVCVHKQMSSYHIASVEKTEDGSDAAAATAV